MRIKNLSPWPDGLWLFCDIIRPMELKSGGWPMDLDDRHRTDLILILGQVLNGV